MDETAEESSPSTINTTKNKTNIIQLIKTATDTKTRKESTKNYHQINAFTLINEPLTIETKSKGAAGYSSQDSNPSK